MMKTKTSFSEFEENVGEVVGRIADSCGDMRGLCDPVATGGRRYTGSGRSPVGNAQYGSRTGKTFLWRERI